MRVTDGDFVNDIAVMSLEPVVNERVFLALHPVKVKQIHHERHKPCEQLAKKPRLAEHQFEKPVMLRFFFRRSVLPTVAVSAALTVPAADHPVVRPCTTITH